MRFVYLWFDRKHHVSIIGSHWGSEDDSYVCSSSSMKNAYKRRPHDFRRRVIVKIADRKELLLEEQRWLDMIKDDEIGKKYYNLRKDVIKAHWTINDGKRKTIGEKISAAKQNMPEESRIRLSKSLKEFYENHPERKQVPPSPKGKIRSPETRKRMSEGMKGKKKRAMSEEHKQKLREASLRAGCKPPSWEGKKHSEETKQKIGNANRKKEKIC